MRETYVHTAIKTIFIFKKKGMMIDGIVAHNFDWSESITFVINASPISDSRRGK